MRAERLSYAHGAADVPLRGVTGKVQKFRMRELETAERGLEAAAVANRA